MTDEPKKPESSPSEELDEQELDQVSGGARPKIDVPIKVPPPSGPVPIPYPNSS